MFTFRRYRKTFCCRRRSHSCEEWPFVRANVHHVVRRSLSAVGDRSGLHWCGSFTSRGDMKVRNFVQDRRNFTRSVHSYLCIGMFVDAPAKFLRHLAKDRTRSWRFFLFSFRFTTRCWTDLTAQDFNRYLHILQFCSPKFAGPDVPSKRGIFGVRA